MGAAYSHDIGDQHIHPMRLSRLGSRPVMDSDLHARAMQERPGLLFARPSTMVLHRSPVQRSGIVANVVNLDKSSLSVLPSEKDPGVLLLQFNFTASVPGYITVYYCARQMVHRASGVDAPIRRVSYEIRPTSPTPEKTKFQPGACMQYRQKPARGLKLDTFSEGRHLTNVVEGYYPIVIRIEARHPADSDVPKRARVVSQSSYAILTRASNGQWGIKLAKQEVLVGGTLYVVQELYGIGAVDVTASKSEEVTANTGVDNVFSVDKSNECVICLSEPCNTAVLPCNHLCLCQDCGSKLSADPNADRRRCPICRTDLESLLRIIPTSMGGEKDAKKRERRALANRGQEIQQQSVQQPVQQRVAQSDGQEANSVPSVQSVGRPPTNANAQPQTKIGDEDSMGSEVSDLSTPDGDGAVMLLPNNTVASSANTESR